LFCQDVNNGRTNDRTAKQEAIEAIERLLDDVALDEILYRLYVLHKSRQGLQDIDEGRTISSGDLEIEEW